jgi:hypothetical protein
MQRRYNMRMFHDFESSRIAGQFKGSTQPFVLYFSERYATCVFKSIKITDAMKLARDEYKALSASEVKLIFITCMSVSTTKNELICFAEIHGSC